MFGKQEEAQKHSTRITDFAYLSDKDIYTDTACQRGNYISRTDR